MNTGSCLCGKVKFEISGTVGPIQICHCRQCRKAQGSAFAANVPVNEINFRFLTGEDNLASYESSPGKHRYFCRIFGSPIFSRTIKLPGVLRVRAGSFVIANL